MGVIFLDRKLQIKLTFKKDEKWLYDKINERSSKSTFIKDVLSDYFKSKKQ